MRSSIIVMCTFLLADGSGTERAWKAFLVLLVIALARLLLLSLKKN